MQNLNSKSLKDTNSDRTVSAWMQRNIDAVQISSGQDPNKLLRRRSQLLGISLEFLRYFFTEDLYLYAYQIQGKQKLTEMDIEKRVTTCE